MKLKCLSLQHSDMLNKKKVYICSCFNKLLQDLFIKFILIYFPTCLIAIIMR